MSTRLNIDGSGIFTVSGILTGTAWKVEIKKTVDGLPADFEDEHEAVIYTDKNYLKEFKTLSEGGALERVDDTITLSENDAANTFLAKTYYMQIFRKLDANNTNRVFKIELIVEPGLWE